MSDFSGLEQSFVLPGMPPAQLGGAGDFAVHPLPERSYDVVLDEVEFRRLHDAGDMQAIQKMRAEIQLPGTAVADPGFVSREKKETGRGSSVPSNGRVTSSGR